MTAESRLRLWKRVACAYGAAIAGAALFVLLAVSYLDASGPEGLAGLAAAAAGASLGPLWLDLRHGVRPRDAVDRMTCGLAAACAVFLAAALGSSHMTSRDLLPLSAIALFPLLVALAGGMRRPGRGAWLVEGVAWLCGGFAWLLLLRQAVMLAILVGRGPTAVSTSVFWPSWVPWQWEDLLFRKAFVQVVAALPFIGFLVIRVRERKGADAGLLAAQALLGVVLLASSYRLAGGIALGGLFLATLATPARRVRLWSGALVVVLCLLPVDVSFQGGGHRGLRFLPARGGDYTADALLNPPSYGFVFVAEGLYYSPRWVWVW